MTTEAGNTIPHAKKKSLSLRANILWNTVGCAFYQGCQWLITVLVVILSNDFANSGILAFAMSIGNVFFAMATYNMRTYQISDVTQENSAGNYVGLRIITTTSAVAICILYACVASSSMLMFLSIAAFLILKSDEAVANVFYGIDQQHERMDYIGRSQIVRGIGAVAFFSTGLVLIKSLPLALLAEGIYCVTITVVYDIPRARRLCGSIAPHIGRSRCISLLKRCLPSVLSLVISGSVVTAVRQIFLFSFGEEALGIYAAVATPSVLIQVLANNIYSPALVPIAELYNARRYREASRKMLRLVGMVFLVGGIVTLGLSLCGKWLLGIVYGEETAQYSYVLTSALIMTTLIAVSYLTADLLILVRCMRRAMVMNIITLVVAAASTVPLITMFYMNGINFALIAAYLVGSLFGGLSLAVHLSRQNVERG